MGNKNDPGLAENPKEAIGLRKPPTSTLPWGPLVEVGQAMSEGEVPPLAALHVPTLYQVALGLTEGALKYGRHNYRVAGGILASVYFDATNRHLDALMAGQDIDPDSGLYHGVKAICSTLVLRDSMIQGSFRDNRPPRSPFDFNEAVSDIVLQDSVLHLCGEAKFAMARWWEGGKPENVIYALTFLFRLCEKHYTGQLADDRAWLDPDFLDKIEQGLNEILLRLPPEKRVPEWTQERLTPTPGVD